MTTAIAKKFMYSSRASESTRDFLLRVFNPNYAYAKELYPLYDKFIANMNECPHCHCGSMYPEDQHGRLFDLPEDMRNLTAFSCPMCGWRFEVTLRIQEVIQAADVNAEEVKVTTPRENNWLPCRVVGCGGLVQEQGNMRYQLCPKHSKRYRNWKSRGEKGDGPFKASHSNDFGLVEVIYRNGPAVPDLGGMNQFEPN